MTCSREFFTGQEDSTPLDTAIYSLVEDAIFGVRGQYVYRFNANTGALEETLRFCEGICFGEASILELNGKLYIGVWRGLLPEVSPQFDVNRDIYIVDYNLVGSVSMGLSAAIDAVHSGTLYPYVNRPDSWTAGFSNLVTNGVEIVGFSDASAERIFKVDPTNVAGVTFQNANIDRAAMVQMTYDSTHDCVFINNPRSQEFEVMDFTTFDNLTRAEATPTAVTTFGHCYVSTTTKVYAVRGTQDLVKFNVNESFPLSGVDFTWSHLPGMLPVNANPFRIRFNLNDGMIYVPNWGADSVTIIDPATDTSVNTVTGFESPIDMVFTPTKVFAVQNAARGLKEL